MAYLEVYEGICNELACVLDHKRLIRGDAVKGKNSIYVLNYHSSFIIPHAPPQTSHYHNNTYTYVISNGFVVYACI